MAALGGVRLVRDGGSGGPEVVAEWRLDGGTARLVAGEGTMVAGDVDEYGLELSVMGEIAARRLADQYGVAMPDKGELRPEDGAALLVGLLAQYGLGGSRMWAEPVESGA
ncbi:MAG TPA: hypothetical protein VMZ50_13430 [Phycisphaerae bacterium]|nr:hypothetical protein [Phycisphaerae bacterium]